jgi:hypothetical protein
MSIEVTKEIQLEIAHVLFLDIVGYSKGHIAEQRGYCGNLVSLLKARMQAVGKVHSGQ